MCLNNNKVRRMSKFSAIILALYVGSVCAQDRVRTEYDTDKGCKYVEYTKPDRVEVRKGITVSWTGTCKDGFIEGQGTLTIVAPNGLRQEEKGVFRGGLENGTIESTTTDPSKGSTTFSGELKDGLKVRGKMEMVSSTGDKQSYEGEFENGVPSGYGKIGNPKFTYEGEIKNGKPNGKGKSVFPNGTVAEGRYLDGPFVSGKITYKEGGVDEGDFKGWKLDGKGKQITPNKNILEGEYKDGKLNGKGTREFPDGTIYEGTFKDGLFSGKGTLVFKGNNRKLTANFVEGKVDGYGKFTESNGDLIYEGNYKNDKPDGQGKSKLSNGDFYEGGFSAGKFSGQGILKLTNGTVFTGEFSDGKFLSGKVVGTSGVTNEGRFKEGRLEGLGKQTLPDGTVFEGNYDAGKANGTFTITYKNGQKRTAKFVDNQEQSPPAAAPKPVPQPQYNNPQGGAGDVPILNLDDAKKKCTNLGFKAGSEPFGKCVLQLSR